MGEYLAHTTEAAQWRDIGLRLQETVGHQSFVPEVWADGRGTQYETVGDLDGQDHVFHFQQQEAGAGDVSKVSYNTQTGQVSASGHAITKAVEHMGISHRDAATLLVLGGLATYDKLKSDEQSER